MAEQSHKREMSDAVRGDFERLRRRLEGGERKATRDRERPSEPLVLTPPVPVEPVAEAPQETEVAAVLDSDPKREPEQPGDVDEASPEPGRSRLRSIFRRG